MQLQENQGIHLHLPPNPFRTQARPVHDGSKDPLQRKADVPPELREYNAMHELLANLMGLSTEHIRVEAGSFWIMEGYFERAVNDLLGQILPLCQQVCQIQEFIKRASSMGLVAQALAAALKSLYQVWGSMTALSVFAQLTMPFCTRIIWVFYWIWSSNCVRTNSPYRNCGTFFKDHCVSSTHSVRPCLPFSNVPFEDARS